MSIDSRLTFDLSVTQISQKNGTKLDTPPRVLRYMNTTKGKWLLDVLITYHFS